MEREKIGGTLVIWPGVAEELLGGKAHMVRPASSRVSMPCCLPMSATICRPPGGSRTAPA